jgi:lipopolysaccharide/colanic/teichoic acid biosynthesis glycosyltransferase
MTNKCGALYKEVKERLDYLQSRECIFQNSLDGEGTPVWKRVLDIVCIVVTAPASLLLGVLIAGIIKAVSPGPVFFRQERVGLLGRRFWCLKFRTMVVNADTEVHQGHLERLMKSDSPMTKLDNAGDSRLIPFGLFLRTLGLDELPQLLNVLKGEMSLVGPRPCLPYEFERYLPRHRERCVTLPGLTGLWQTSGKNKTTFEEMIDLDVHYARRKSLLMDLKIIAMTIPAIVIQAIEVRRCKRAPLATSDCGLEPRGTVGQKV